METKGICLCKQETNVEDSSRTIVTLVNTTASTTHLPTENMVWNPVKDMPDLKGRVALVTGGKSASNLQLLFF